MSVDFGKLRSDRRGGRGSGRGGGTLHHNAIFDCLLLLLFSILRLLLKFVALLEAIRLVLRKIIPLHR